MPLPSITTLMSAYNAAPFVGEALDSAMAQDYPAELLEVVVVDDGSTDGTAEVVAERARRHPGRIRLIRQPNAGHAAAFSRAAEEVRGELVAMLDADDVWPPEKIRCQVEALAARPEAGLLYGDMTVIDRHGHVLQASWLEGDMPYEGRCAGALLEGNPATSSSLLIRAHVLRELLPVPADIAWADWWLAVEVARRWGVVYLAEPRTFYRFHGSNMSLGAKGAERRRELVRAVAFQRWFLRRITLEEATPRDLHRAWESIERNAREAVKLANSAFAPIAEVTEDDREQARALAARGEAVLARGDAPGAVLDLLRAAATDPWHPTAREAFVAALGALPGGEDVPGPQPLEGAGDFVVLSDATELLSEPQLLEAYAAAMRGAPGVTLAIDASALEADRATADLGVLAERTGVANDESVDVMLVVGDLDAVGRARLNAGARALLGSSVGPGLDRPRFTGADLGALRALAAPAPAVAA